jgi:ABC-type nickel/cobalt efflux system permease component RcnA
VRYDAPVPSLPLIAVASPLALTAPLTLPAPWSFGATAAVLGLGLLFGVKHATETDHLAAVGVIVSERRGWRAAVRAGALWGLGHTLSIVAAGLLVLALHVVIPERVARLLELGVAFMIIALGGTALARALRARTDVHVHEHTHDGVRHRHLHFHDTADAHPAAHAASPHTHRLGRGGLKPFLVGIVHGLAGSAALTLLVLAPIGSVPLGLLYLALFGAGSIGGMAGMSLALSVPFSVVAARPGLYRGLRIATGILSLGFGLVYAWSQVRGVAV